MNPTIARWTSRQHNAVVAASILMIALLMFGIGTSARPALYQSPVIRPHVGLYWVA
jgi:hypothetical protein